MKAKALPVFWKLYHRLPQGTQDKADKQFALWLKSSAYPSLHFKKIAENLWSVRIDDNYRALARFSNGHYIWFWIGNHAEYERMLREG